MRFSCTDMCKYTNCVNTGDDVGCYTITTNSIPAALMTANE